MDLVAAVGAGVAWFGAALLVLADGRRGLCVGLIVTALGVGAVALASNQAVVATVLVAGAAIGGLLRLRDGQLGWGLLAPGSTPRLVLSILTLFGVLVVVETIQGSTPALFATLAVCVLAVTRLTSTQRRSGALGAAALLALGLAPLGGPPAAMVAAIAIVAHGVVPAEAPLGAAA
jgi:hypothetical protein